MVVASVLTKKNEIQAARDALDAEFRACDRKIFQDAGIGTELIATIAEAILLALHNWSRSE